MTQPNVAELDLEAATKERELFVLTTQVAEAQRRLTQIELSAQRSQEALAGLGEQLRVAKEDVEQHFRNTYARVEGEYRAKVADFNTSIEALRQERAGLVADVDGLSATKTTLSIEVDSLSGAKEKLSAAIAALEKKQGAESETG